MAVLSVFYYLCESKPLMTMSHRLKKLYTLICLFILTAPLFCACSYGHASQTVDAVADPATAAPRLHAMVEKAADCFDQGKLLEAFRIIRDADTAIEALSPEERASLSGRDMFRLQVYKANIYSNYRDFASAAKYYGQAIRFASTPRDSLQMLLNISVMSSHCGDSLAAVASAGKLCAMKIKDADYNRYACAVAYAYIEKYFGDSGKSRDLFRRSLSMARSGSLKLHSSLTPVSELYEYYSSRDILDSMILYLEDYKSLAETFRAPEMMADVNKGFWRAYTLMGDRDKAMSAYEAYFSIVDSIYNPAGFHALNSKYNEENLSRTNDRMMRLELTVSRQKIIISAIAAIIALALIAWLMWRRARMSQRRIFFLNREIARQEAASVSEAADAGSVSTPSECGADNGSDECNIQDQDRSRHAALMRDIYAALADPVVYCDPEFSIAQLARLVGSNSKYVSQAVNECTGMNFRTFINSLRVKVARSRLAGSGEYANLTIQAVSESVGFKSTSNFVLAFKKVMGITPSAYQKLAKNSIDS